MPPIVADVRIGHWTGVLTGCTVVLMPEGTVASGEVRGGAPATREFALLHPSRAVERLDAVVLTGGSAFGLATADGVIQHLADEGVGFPTSAGAVPIVVAMALYDLAGTAQRPGAPEGTLAALSARTGDVPSGRVGAGAGATVSKWRGLEHAVPGGLGIATERAGDIEVSAIVAVNASGDIDDGSTTTDIREGRFVPPDITPFENTTIAVVVTNAELSKAECAQAATSAHDGFARTIVPVHTAADGDAVVVASTARLERPHAGANSHLPVVRLLTLTAMESAIRSAVDRTPPS